MGAYEKMGFVCLAGLLTGWLTRAILSNSVHHRSWEVSVPTSVAPSGKVRATGVGPQRKKDKDAPPVVLLHGFDSSCLEFR